jgi:AAA+ superfamily predicted ATPase
MAGVCLKYFDGLYTGTGKTAVAKLYARILKDLGMLSSSDYVKKNASELIGSAVGETKTKANALFDSASGKVILIDEAYTLIEDSCLYGPEVLNILVERIQNSDDFAVLLCGYTEQMITMLDEKGNQGLSRRFDTSNRFMFQDYTKEQLLEIMMLKSQGKFTLSRDLALRAIESEVEPCRPKRGFGNAGLIDDLLKTAGLNFNGRSDGKRQGGLPVLLESDLISPKKAPEWRFPQQEMDDYFKDLKVALNDEKENPDFKMSQFIEEYVQNWTFVGPTGTGKTSTAQAFAHQLHDLGIFSRREAIVLKASEACAGFVGQTHIKVSELLQKARGGVLVFDEAHALMPEPGGGEFKREVVEALVANLESPTCLGQMCVILTGYKHKISQFLGCDEGLPNRFMKQLHIPPWTPAQCTAFLRTMFDAKENEPPNLPHELDTVIEQSFSDLQGYDNFGSARDVKRGIFFSLKQIWTKRAKKEVPGQKVFMVFRCFQKLDSSNQIRDFRFAKSSTPTYLVRTSSKRLKH